MIATTAITAFALEPAAMHTLVKWCWTMSLVFSFLCVYISSNVVRRVGRFLRTDDTLHYVRVKKDVVTGRTYHPKRHDSLENTDTTAEAYYLRTEYGYVYLPSLSAVIIISISRWSLLLSVHTFLAGLGLMPYFWWKNKDENATEASKEGGRLIFWSFIVTMILFTIGWMHIRLQHAGEQDDHDVRDRLIVGLESRRQSHMDEQGCKSKEEWIAWRKQVKSTMEHPSGPPSATFTTSRPTNRSPTADHTHDLEAGDQSAKPGAIKRALSRFSVFGAVDGKPVNFGQWIPTWGGRRSSEHRGWLDSLRVPSLSHPTVEPIMLKKPRTDISPPQSPGGIAKKQQYTSPDTGVTTYRGTPAHLLSPGEDISLADLCREVATVAEQCAASARQQARLTAMLASHVSGERQAISTSVEAQEKEGDVVPVGVNGASTS